MSAALELDLTRNGRRIVVSQSDRHPEEYLYIDIDGSRFFLGVLEKGMQRDDVRAMAERWLVEHRRA